MRTDSPWILSREVRRNRGTAIAEMAHSLGYSQRTIYRALDRLYHTLGVTDRIQAVRKAATEGLLDD